MLLHITQIAHYYTYYTYNKTTLLGCNNNRTFIVTISIALQIHHTLAYLTHTADITRYNNDQLSLLSLIPSHKHVTYATSILQ